ncbi:chalcone-flavanone isomerase-domain-containing protein [Dioszegia hungarica]|uniref:Chalcone-flavanone isomerase-domain-containing protein n=1 Tax=Dioszegia hungarica TaxID=4972 RepID=A0AA38LUY3_9TREE|nr:chalcone-flavanone isomerase-domain-containing protein [Dioszegia hungarica]KAI9636495.1 chalcone-flavanone isomerase-domain-containing protein [Dioszegia hungarica]
MRGTAVCRQAVHSLRSGAARSSSSRIPLRFAQTAFVAVAIGGIVWTAPDFRKSWVIKNDAAPQVDHRVSADDKDAMRFDPDTQIPFPLHIAGTSASSPALSLVGLGVRKVSFLRVKVYSVAFYLEDSLTSRLRDIPGWRSFSAFDLIAAPASAPAAAPPASSALQGEALMASLLDQPVACAVRIVPTRNTDFAHLRDGFTRAIQARQKLARVGGRLTDAEEERIAQSTQTLKAMFPSQSVPKGKALTLTRLAKGELVVEYEGKLLGRVNDPWISRELMLAYFADKDVISPKLKEDVASGLEALCKR